MQDQKKPLFDKILIANRSVFPRVRHDPVTAGRWKFHLTASRRGQLRIAQMPLVS